MKVTIQLYAAARQLVGQDVVELVIRCGNPTSDPEIISSTGPMARATGANAPTVRHLRQALAKKFPALASLLPQVLFALDAEYATDDSFLTADMEIACIPPVSGG